MLKYFIIIIIGIFILVVNGKDIDRSHKNRHSDRLKGRDDGDAKDDVLKDDGNDAPATDPAPTTIEEITTEEPTTKKTTTEEPTTTTTRITTTLRPIRTYDQSVWCKMQIISVDCDGKGRTFTRYFYDTKLKGCLQGVMTNCANNLNQFKDAKSCHKACREHENTNVNELNPDVACRLQPEFGNCNNYNPMYYYDVNERLCKGFSYSGCGGNTNRFNTVLECISICGHVVKMVPA